MILSEQGIFENIKEEKEEDDKIRNSIKDKGVFYTAMVKGISKGEIARVVNGTFLNDAECINAIVEASNTYNINGFYLVAKMLTEHGTNGSTLSSSDQKRLKNVI